MAPLRCRVLGHKLPRRKRPFFLTERFQRCDRCGARIRIKTTGQDQERGVLGQLLDLFLRAGR